MGRPIAVSQPVCDLFSGVPETGADKELRQLPFKLTGGKRKGVLEEPQ